MNFPDDLRYTKDHEWVRLDKATNTATLGITDFAQNELGDVVFVDLPAVGRTVKQGESFCVVESTKAAADVYAAIGGKVKEINSGLSEKPELLNKDPYSGGWLAKLEAPSLSDLEKLMDATAYKKFVNA